jgi:hypothetical protein
MVVWLQVLGREFGTLSSVLVGTRERSLRPFRVRKLDLIISVRMYGEIYDWVRFASYIEVEKATIAPIDEDVQEGGKGRS